MVEKIGTDIPSAVYWSQKADSYIEGIRGPYHRHRLEVVRALIRDVDLAGQICLDFGCGDGIFSSCLVQGGAKIIGYDTDAQMIEVARQRFSHTPFSDAFKVGGVERLGSFDSQSVDAVFALNVLAYLPKDEEEEFYRQSARITRPGGRLVVTHSNELFDMYTLNQYTAMFFQHHFGTRACPCDVSSLLTFPNKPDRKTFSVRENPLSYRYKLAKYGFTEQAQEFASLHPLPPLLIPDWDADDINARQYMDTLNWPAEHRWKLMFMCSMFGSHSRREPAGE